MKKIVIALALTIASGAFASEACQRNCQTAYDQSGLACFKTKQMCIKFSGIAGNERLDMCEDDYSMCLEKSSTYKDNCLQSCDDNQD